MAVLAALMLIVMRTPSMFPGFGTELIFDNKAGPQSRLVRLCSFIRSGHLSMAGTKW